MLHVQSPHAIRGYIMSPGEGRMLASLRTRLLATGVLTGDNLCVVECVNPGPGGPPLHTHHAHVEFFFVLQGRYRFRIGESDREGGPGTFAYVPRDVIHGWASVGSEEGRLLAAIMPGEFARFLEQLEDLAARGAGQEEYVALYGEYQSEINGPPLV